MRRVGRALHLIPPEIDYDPGTDIEIRIEAIVAKIDSLEARVAALEQMGKHPWKDASGPT